MPRDTPCTHTMHVYGVSLLPRHLRGHLFIYNACSWVQLGGSGHSDIVCWKNMTQHTTAHTLEVLDTVTAGQIACVAWAKEAVDGGKWLITIV
jgi:hypothetical protein